MYFYIHRYIQKTFTKSKAFQSCCHCINDIQKKKKNYKILNLAKNY